MGNRRFSLTTWVLVGLSLFALYFVGKTVTPAPPAPPKEAPPTAALKTPAQPDAVSPEKQKLQEDRAKEEMKARAQQMKQMAAKTKSNPQANTKEFNPNTIDTDNKYWNDPTVTDGGDGEKAMRARVADALAKQKPQPNGPVIRKATPINQSQ